MKPDLYTETVTIMCPCGDWIAHPGDGSGFWTLQDIENYIGAGKKSAPIKCDVCGEEMRLYRNPKSINQW